MDKYIKYLVEDIRKAAIDLPTPPYLDLDEEMEDLRGVIEYESTTEKPMQEWFKLSKENFPPVEKLDQKQIELLLKEILNLWSAFNFDPVLPKNLPAEIAYKLLVDYFDKPVVWVSEGTIMIEFCNYDSENCPFPQEYCMCTDLNDDTKYFGLFDNSLEIAELKQEIEVLLKDKTQIHKTNKKNQKYLNQLIADLDKKSKEALDRPSIPDNIEIRSAKDMKDLVEKPFLSLEELSEINYESFPDIIGLNEIQVRQILIAILQLFDAYKLKIHHPENIPAEIKYEAIVSEWDSIFIKDLPESGDDIDLCTNDVETCPYALYCTCEQEMDDDLLDDLPFDKDMNDREEEGEDELPF
jgi:hypothetical protein